MNKLPVPSSDEIDHAYHSLISQKNITVKNWISYSRMCRFDPRLAEAFIKRFSNDWHTLPCLIFRELNLASPHPGTLGVLLEQVESYLLNNDDKKLFSAWKNLVLHQTPKGSGESFLIGFQPFASMQMFSDAECPLNSFKKWGYSGSDIFVNKAKSKLPILKKTGLNNKSRKIKLDQFLWHCKKTKQNRFTIDEYLIYLNHLVSRRVAQLDLKKNKNIIAHGKTRSLFYTIN